MELKEIKGKHNENNSKNSKKSKNSRNSKKSKFQTPLQAPGVPKSLGQAFEEAKSRHCNQHQSNPFVKRRKRKVIVRAVKKHDAQLVSPGPRTQGSTAVRCGVRTAAEPQVLGPGIFNFLNCLKYFPAVFWYFPYKCLLMPLISIEIPKFGLLRSLA